jgi:hypothetical protein
VSARANVAVVVAAAAFFGAQPHHHGHGHGTGIALDDAAVHMTGGYSPRSWAVAYLHAGHFRATGCNIAGVEGQERAEGTYGSFRNPLDSTEREPGSYPVNSAGVQHYASWRQGLRATVVTLRNGRYPAMISALRAGDDAQRYADAVAASPWGTAPYTVNC